MSTRAWLIGAGVVGALALGAAVLASRSSGVVTVAGPPDPGVADPYQAFGGGGGGGGGGSSPDPSAVPGSAGVVAPLDPAAVARQGAAQAAGGAVPITPTGGFKGDSGDGGVKVGGVGPSQVTSDGPVRPDLNPAELLGGPGTDPIQGLLRGYGRIYFQGQSSGKTSYDTKPAAQLAGKFNYTPGAASAGYGSWTYTGESYGSAPTQEEWNAFDLARRSLP